MAQSKCEWKRGDEARTWASGIGGNVGCHFLEWHDSASRPPVKAALWLASLGLDGARP